MQWTVTPMEISNGLVTIREDKSISHEEGDTIIIQQAFTAGRRLNEGVSIIANDTGVFLLLVYYYSELKCTFPMFMASTDERDIIDIGMTGSKHVDIIPSMFGAHTMTGCDTVAR